MNSDRSDRSGRSERSDRSTSFGPFVAGCLLVAAIASPPAIAQRADAPVVRLFEGSRLIVGDGRPPIENAAFLVDGDKFVRVAGKGEIQLPAGASRVDLTGKTVIPALIDAHSHIGYMNNLTSGPQNYTRENILDHMRRFAYFGVAASQAMGSDFGELPYRLRDELKAGKYPDAARFLTAGRGLAPEDEVRPDNMRHSAYTIRTEDDARKAVRELSAHHVKIVKTWVDDRGGTIRKLTPALFGAIIDEAHKLNMRVAVHATGPADAKDLLRAGIDIFAHMMSDVDEELVELFRQHPQTSVLLALGGPRRTVWAPWIDPPHPLVSQTVTPEQIKRLRDRLASTRPDAREQAGASWERLSAGIRKLNAANVRIGVGTDGGGQTGDQFIGWTMHTEMENMVAAGMTPAQVLVAATRTSAEILGLDDLGTVTAGKSADFVVLDANPLDDITNSRKIAHVYLRGQLIDRARLKESFMD
jgi:imidazolonepropionase-like amidohydrolase